MGLTAEEKAQLERLSKKAKEPDAPPPSVNYTLDLGNDSAWERAQKLGLIPGEASPDPEGGEGEGEGEGEDGPKRGGYFGDQ